MKIVTPTVRLIGERRSVAVAAAVGAVLFVVGFVSWLNPATETPNAADESDGPMAAGSAFQYWTSAGSAGTVDEADDHLVAFTGPAVSILNSAPASSNLLIRYNVTVTDNMGDFTDTPFLQVRFRDNGDGARVIARLRQLNMNTGVNTLLLTLDSNDYPPSTIYQQQYVQANAGTMPFNFELNIFYVEVTIVRSSASGTPAVTAIMVGRY